jgi:hypothetical protein
LERVGNVWSVSQDLANVGHNASKPQTTYIPWYTPNSMAKQTFQNGYRIVGITKTPPPSKRGCGEAQEALPPNGNATKKRTWNRFELIWKKLAKMRPGAGWLQIEAKTLADRQSLAAAAYCHRTLSLTARKSGPYVFITPAR